MGKSWVGLVSRGGMGTSLQSGGGPCRACHKICREDKDGGERCRQAYSWRDVVGVGGESAQSRSPLVFVAMVRLEGGNSRGGEDVKAAVCKVVAIEIH